MEWPPISPRHVLQTPTKSSTQKGSGSQLSDSPSPLKERLRDGSIHSGHRGHDEADDDEEALLEKLETIKAQLALKKAQNKKRKREHSNGSDQQDMSNTPPATEKVQIKKTPVKTSPTRMLLGIDKGLTGRDVSLRNPNAVLKPSPPKPKMSFTEKLAQVRTKEEDTKKRETLRKSKTSGWNKDGENLITDDPETADLHEHEHFTNFKIRRRLRPHSALRKHFDGKEIMSIHQFLAQVHPPDFEYPDHDDLCVVGVVASKTQPIDVKQNRDRVDEKQNKFCVLTLTDLAHEIPIFLFGDAFKRYWKIQTGTVIAILNPEIMKPRKQANQEMSKLGLKLSELYDDILEVGFASDLGFCSAMLRSGKPCGEWIDRRKTEICDYHIDASLDKVRSGRMNLQGGGLGARFRKMDGKPTKSRQSKKKKEIDYNEIQKMYSYGGGTLYGMQIGERIDREFDPASSLTEEEKRDKFRQQQTRAESERKILTALSRQNKSTASEYLRMDHDTSQSTETEDSERFRPFTATHLRRIGFDPTARLADHCSKAQVDSFTGSLGSREIRLSPQKKKRHRPSHSKIEQPQSSSSRQTKQLPNDSDGDDDDDLVVI